MHRHHSQAAGRLERQEAVFTVPDGGYSVCPIPTGYGNVVMAEFDGDGQPVSSFLVDPTRERWSLWLLKTRLLPWLYWHRVLRGLPREGRCLMPLAPLVHWLQLDSRLPPPARR